MSGGDGPPNPEQLRQLLSRCEQLRAYGRSHGLELDDDPASLGLLDERLDEWKLDPEIAASLGNEVALYLGSVIVGHVPDVEWRPWPNGQPVVRLADGREIDVVSVASERLHGGGPSLVFVYDDAAGQR